MEQRIGIEAERVAEVRVAETLCVQAQTVHTEEVKQTLASDDSPCAEGCNLEVSGVARLDQAKQDGAGTSRAFLEAMVASSTDAICGAGVNGIILSWNQGAESLIGHSSSEIIGQSLDSFAMPGRAYIVRQLLDTLQDGGVVKPYETQFRHKDGTAIDVSFSISSVFDRQNQIIGFCVIARDIRERRQVETKLQGAADRLQLAARAGGVGTWDYDVATERIVWDEQMPALYGFENDRYDAGYNAWVANVHPEDREQAQADLQAAILGEKEYDSEFRIVWPDRSIHSIRALGLVQRDKSGTVTHIVGTNWDITPQKQFEMQLRESEERYRATFEQAAVGIVHTSLQGRMLRANNRFAEIIGYTLDEIGSLTFAQITQPGDLALSNDELEKLLDGTVEILNWEKRYIRKDGSLTWVRVTVSVQRNATGSAEHFITLVEDINSRKLIEAKLRQADEQSANLRETVLQLELEKANDLHRLILDTAGEGIYGLDANGVTTFANPAALALLGFTGAEVIGQMQHSMSHHSYPDGSPYPEDQCLIYKAMHEGRIYFCDTEFFWRKDGTSIPISYTSTPLLRDDKVDGAVVVFQEISERKRREMADAANEAKSEFLAIMSHELRTPLNGMMGMIDLLLDSNLAAGQRDFAEVALRSGHFLLALINDILDLSKIEAGKLELEYLELDLDCLLDHLLTTLRVSANANGIALEGVREANVPGFLIGDPRRLSQLLMNLISNAIKFTAQGKVVLRISLAETAEKDCLLHISVRDTGIGIPFDKLEMIFDKFNQVDASTTRNFGGTGLGLAIAKQLAESMGGTIGARSKLGEGSEFWCTVRLGLQHPTRKQPSTTLASISGLNLMQCPLKEDTSTSCDVCKNGYESVEQRSRPGDVNHLAQLERSLSQFPSSSSPRIDATRNIHSPSIASQLIALSGRRILLAEDNAVNQTVALAMLERLGLRTDVVSDGFQAIDALTRRAYDLVLMDMRMPNLDGVEATRTIRNSHSAVLNHSVPIVAMTANVTPLDRSRCLEAGMNSFVAKPFTLKSLQIAIEDCLEPRESRSRLPVRDMSVSGLNQALTETMEEAEREIFDRETVLERMGGEISLLHQVLASFLLDFPHQLKILIHLTDSGDSLGAALTSHAIRGAAATAGAERLSKLAFRIETAADRGNLVALGELIPALEAAFIEFSALAEI